MSNDPEDRRRFVALLRRHGSDAVAFQGLAEPMRIWFAEGAGEREGGVAYFDTGAAWVAAGGPVAAPGERRRVAEGFVDAARQAGRRASFFATEDLAPFTSWKTLLLGEQPSTTPAEWALALKKTRTLREQLRRARAKGVTVAVVGAQALEPGTSLRRSVDALLERWVASRRIEPMAFLVSTDPYAFADLHTYVVATRGNDVLGLLSAIPAYGEDGWLVEHLMCARSSPNGTAETLLDALYRARADAGKPNERISLGLAPLTGRVTPWMRVARAFARPLFDFEGLHRFKARLHPSEWRGVWLVAPRGSSSLVALVDALTAFAGGSLVRFALRSLLFHARGLLWLLAFGLVPWTGLLVWLDATRASGVAGYTTAALAWWIGFDALLALGLFRASFRPAYRTLFLLIAASLTDALISWVHLHTVGLGPTLADSLLRVAAALAPTGGATTLAIITVQRARERTRSGETR